MPVEKVAYPKEFKNTEWQKKKGILGNLMGKKESGLKAILEPMERFYNAIAWDPLVEWANEVPTAGNAQRLLTSEGRVNSDLGNLRGILKKLGVLGNQIMLILPDFEKHNIALKSQTAYLNLIVKKIVPFKKELKDVIAACVKQNVKLRLAGVDAGAINGLTIPGIIGDGKLRKCLRDFLEEDNAAESLDFVLAVGAGVTDKAKANTIYDTYVAANELNITNYDQFKKLRENDWREQVDSDGEVLKEVNLNALFLKAVKQLVDMLKNDKLSNFKNWLKARQ